MKIAGFDIGTNSIGIAVRDSDKSSKITEQLDYFTSVIFKSGVGNGKSGEFSYAAQRTKFRTVRNLYKSRKYRIWQTLSILIEYNYCPLSKEDLDKWRIYDKEKGLKREYPTNATLFEQWVRLDFNGDGVADYSSPYQLRAELLERTFDFSQELERFKLGRVLYHIAQRRGFRSSKGETLKEQEKTELLPSDELNVVAELKKSEQKKSSLLVAYMAENNLKTVGQAFAHLENRGIRVRNSEYQAVRSQYKDEIKLIFEFQNFNLDSEFCKHILSEKKKEGTIFYKRPLRSQKGLIGKCTLESNKARCPISHPEFEKFRAWSFINNIKFGEGLNNTLTIEQKNKLFTDKFLLTKTNFKFEDIRKWIEKEVGAILSYSNKTINYKDNTNVSGCPIAGRLKRLLGEEWEKWTLETTKERLNKKTGEIHKISYTYNDIWHICFSFDESEYIEEFAQKELCFNEEQTRQFTMLWGSISQGYAMLSLKAITNINRFLQKGLIYTDAVLLAKLPDLFNEKWDEYEETITNELDKLLATNRKEKQLFNIANSLIANYKSLNESEMFAFKNYEYVLDADDYNDIQKATIDALGERTWISKTTEEQKQMLSDVAVLYQNFFTSCNRDYYKLPKLSDSLSSYLCSNFSFLTPKMLKKIYHPSMIESYAPAKEQLLEDGRSMKLLGSPVIGALKNPMAMRVLYTLRRQCNKLLVSGTINENTRIVVETARELNDANMRWAIKTYQEEREKENEEYVKILQEYYPNRSISDVDIDKIRILFEQNDIKEEASNKVIDVKKEKKEAIKRIENYKKDISKYRLWIEQGCRCIYTGKIINISSLFDANSVDFEHTIPRSISFDNSLANLTVCDAYFNRTKKKNRIPSQLDNYDDILLRIQPWIDKVEQLKENVAFWKAQSKRAQEKERKDHCIRQRHRCQMELDYWRNKVERFTMVEVTSGFRNNQLNDTRIITKYAYHYLKTVFQRVEVQKGSVTADFRKMLGVQSLSEKKNRDKHSHHAIDATILTLIPVAAKRDKMLEMFYQIQEKEHFNEDTTMLRGLLDKELYNCKLLSSNISGVVPFIESNILVNHVSKDQTLTPASRKARKRGKEILVEDKDGNLKNKWIKGDCIRAKLHKESYFGAAKIPQADENGEFIKKDGAFLYKQDKKGNDIISMVKRILISNFQDQNDFEKIIDPRVRETVKSLINERINNGKTFAAALAESIWLLDKKGNEIKFDKNGKALLPIRHIRCRVSAGKGYFTKEKAIEIKKQTYKSSKDYKNSFYAQNDGNYLCLLYKTLNKGKIERKTILLNYFEVLNLGIKDIKQLWNEPFFQVREERKKQYNLLAIIKVGTRVLMWEKSSDEINHLSDSELSKRLFIVYKFNLKGVNCVYLQNHIEARSDISAKEDYTIFNKEIYQARLTLVANNFNCLIEGCDFEISTDGKFRFK